MVFGTFDALHKGHLNFFKQALNLAKNPFLIVSVARDVNVKKVKGRLPRNSERQRLRALKKIAWINKPVLGNTKKYLSHIAKERPEIIALGYDQGEFIKNLRLRLKKTGLTPKIIRLKPYRPEIYKSSKIKK